MFSEFSILFGPFFFVLCVVEMIDLFLGVVSLDKAMYQSSFSGLEFHQDIGTNCASVTVRNCSVLTKRKSLFFHLFYYPAFQLPKLTLLRNI